MKMVKVLDPKNIPEAFRKEYDSQCDEADLDEYIEWVTGEDKDVFIYMEGEFEDEFVIQDVKYCDPITVCYNMGNEIFTVENVMGSFMQNGNVFISEDSI